MLVHCGSSYTTCSTHMVYRCTILVICRFEFVTHKIALTRMEPLICALHLLELSPVTARSGWQGTSRAGPQLGSGPSVGISARFAKLALNHVMISHFGMLPSVDEFSEEFAGFPITNSIDYFSSFHKIPLAAVSHDLTTFLTALGLVRMTRMPQCQEWEYRLRQEESKSFKVINFVN